MINTSLIIITIMIIINHGHNNYHQSGSLRLLSFIIIMVIMIITFMMMIVMIITFMMMIIMIITFMMMIMMMQVIVLTISSLVYFAEKDGVKKWTFLESFWSKIILMIFVCCNLIPRPFFPIFKKDSKVKLLCNACPSFD